MKESAIWLVVLGLMGMIEIVLARRGTTCEKAVPISNLPLNVTEEALSAEDPEYDYDYCHGGVVGIWYSYYAEHEQILNYTVVRPGENSNGYPAPIAILEGSSACSSTTCIDDYLNKGSRLFATKPNMTYYFFIGSEKGGAYWGNAGLPFNIQLVSPTQENDQRENALMIPDPLPFTDIFSNVGATSDIADDVCGLGGLVYGVWFKYTTIRQESPSSTAVVARLNLEVSEPEFALEMAVMATNMDDGTRYCIDIVQNSQFFRSDVYDIIWDAVADVTYEILVAGTDPEFRMNTFRLSLKMIQLNPLGSLPSENAQPLTNDLSSSSKKQFWHPFLFAAVIVELLALLISFGSFEKS